MRRRVRVAPLASAVCTTLCTKHYVEYEALCGQIMFQFVAEERVLCFVEVRQ